MSTIMRSPVLSARPMRTHYCHQLGPVRAPAVLEVIFGHFRPENKEKPIVVAVASTERRVAPATDIFAAAVV
eukprot:2560279-Lingulodinium_polyedra.AAC.1